MRARGLTDYTKFRRVKPLSPRLRNAVRLYASGIVPTKKAAALAVGLAPSTFYQVSCQVVNDPGTKALFTQVDQLVQDETIDTRRLIEIMSRQAIGKIGNLMNGAAKEEVQFMAARDLADRGQETSKIQRMQVESFTLSGKDVAGLRESMVEAARVKAANASLTDEDFIRLDGGLVDGERIEVPAGYEEANAHEGPTLRLVKGPEEGKG